MGVGRHGNQIWFPHYAVPHGCTCRGSETNYVFWRGSLLPESVLTSIDLDRICCLTQLVCGTRLEVLKVLLSVPALQDLLLMLLPLRLGVVVGVAVGVGVEVHLPNLPVYQMYQVQVAMPLVMLLTSLRF
jgi:hypothetical protein